MKVTIIFHSTVADAAAFLNRLTLDGPNSHGMQSAAIKAEGKKHHAEFDSAIKHLDDFKLWVNSKAPQGSGISIDDYEERA